MAGEEGGRSVCKSAWRCKSRQKGRRHVHLTEHNRMWRDFRVWCRCSEVVVRCLGMQYSNRLKEPKGEGRAFIPKP